MYILHLALKMLRWPGWLTRSGRFIHNVVTQQLQVERRTGEVRRPETDVLPLCHATNLAGTESRKMVDIWTTNLRAQQLSSVVIGVDAGRRDKEINRPTARSAEEQ